MNVLFVYSLAEAPSPPAKPLNSWTKIQLGLSYISSVLKRAGHKTKTVVPGRVNFEKGIDRAMDEFPTDIICFTAVSTEYPFIHQVAQYVRSKAPSACMVIGGPHASLQPEEVMKGPFDAVCVGEGEYPVKELASALEEGKKPEEIPNLWVRTDHSVQKNTTRKFVENLDQLPFPDREIWKPWVEHDTQHSVLVGRGCPYRCTYCCNHMLRNLAGGRYVRFRSPANVMEEIRHVSKEFPDVSEIFLEVETITANQKWAFEFCSLMEEFNFSGERPVALGTNVRVIPGKSLQPLFEAFCRAGFQSINMGIESGSERVRSQVLKRIYRNQDLIRTCDEAHQAGLRINAYNMIGLPGETPEDFKKTLEVNRRCLPERNYLSIFCPYPGTELYRVCVERGLNVELTQGSMERFRPVLGLPEFPDKQVMHYFRWFDWYVYRRKKPLLKILSHAALRTLGAYPRLFRAFRFVTSRGPLASLRRWLG